MPHEHQGATSFTKTDRGSQLVLGAWSHLPPQPLRLEPSSELQQASWASHCLLADAGPISTAGPWMPHLVTPACCTTSGPRTTRTSAAFSDPSNQISFGQWRLHKTNRILLHATPPPSTRYYQASCYAFQWAKCHKDISVSISLAKLQNYLGSKCSIFLSVTTQSAILWGKERENSSKPFHDRSCHILAQALLI